MMMKTKINLNLIKMNIMNDRSADNSLIVVVVDNKLINNINIIIEIIASPNIKFLFLSRLLLRYYAAFTKTKIPDPVLTPKHILTFQHSLPTFQLQNVMEVSETAKCP